MGSKTIRDITISADGKTASGTVSDTKITDVVSTLFDTSSTIVGPMRHAQTAAVAVGGMMGESYMRTGSPRIKLISGS